MSEKPESITMREYINSGKAADHVAATIAASARNLSVQTMANYVKTGVVQAPPAEVLGTMTMGEYIAQGSSVPIEADVIVDPVATDEDEAEAPVKKAAKKKAAPKS